MMRTLTIHPTDKDQVKALEIILKAMGISYENVDTKDVYNPEFVKKIRRARKEYKDGKGTVLSLEEFKELCK